MALTLVDTGSSSLNSNTSHSFGINPSGTNRLLVVFAVKGALSGVANSISFNGYALTKIDSQFNIESGNSCGIEVWILANPPTGEANVTADLSGGSGAAKRMIFGYALSGASSIFRTISKNYYRTNVISNLKITGSPGDYILATTFSATSFAGEKPVFGSGFTTAVDLTDSWTCRANYKVSTGSEDTPFTNSSSGAESAQLYVAIKEEVIIINNKLLLLGVGN